MDGKIKRLLGSLASQRRCQQIQLGLNKVWKPRAELLASEDMDTSQGPPPPPRRCSVGTPQEPALGRHPHGRHGAIHALFHYLMSLVCHIWNTGHQGRYWAQETCAGVTAEPGVKDQVVS